MGVATTRSADGTTIAYETAGSGPDVIVVAGTLCDRSVGTDLARVDGPPLRVTTYDRRGRGDSTDTAPYAVAREVEDLAAVAAALGRPPLLYGASSGAALALEAAAAGVDVAGLVLFEPPLLAFPAAPVEEAATIEGAVGAALADGRPGDAVAALLSLAVGVPDEQLAALRDDPAWPGLERLAPTIAYDLAVGAAARAHLAGYGAIAAPALAAAGSDSGPAALASARLLAATLPAGEVRVLEGQTHEVATVAVAPLLRELLAEG